MNLRHLCVDTLQNNRLLGKDPYFSINMFNRENLVQESNLSH